MELSADNYTDVLISQVFQLNKNTNNRFDKTNRIILREYLADTVSPEQLNSVNTINPFYSFPASFYNNSQPMRTILHNFHRSPLYHPNWLYNIPQDEIIFETYYLSKRIGCPHYLSKALLACKFCENSYGCKFCHDEAQDHKFALKHIICRFCQHAQKFSLTCENCSQAFGSVSCAPCCFICEIDTDVKPFFHCEDCGHCRVGDRADYEHCAKCSRCIEVEEVANHVCKQLGTCPICLEEIEQSNRGFIVPKCGHTLHGHCFEGLRGISCPVCRKTIYDDNRIKQIQFQLFRQKKVAGEVFCKGKCWDCAQEFVAPQAGVICQKCKFVNCDVQGMASLEEYLEYKKGFADFVEIRRVISLEEALKIVEENQIPINGVFDIQLDIYEIINDFYEKIQVEQ